ncbi:acetoin dehydrogenase complex [Agrilactobacillus composti DSM 18527 = JCM 14202]|uniref:Acetoin dehydrogenase complex n=1 Tax=Agrilactobacillus composti DSM 18527 = JCM 14202 TaxID=1423734 RepID=X0PNP3_9LACO|nr:alpha-ketoacid dehydrogenase subunit beta [Agrilactobacillus composti]KRM33112.1 acetoin dehydrogenase complex [Agrilactobacillus composti DSM 18527 = JCM 14202]GAF38531.1 branched-chain alpha-keto acid dehydrogenase, E1 component, beta subunit [Agrilactobacillus composti DSM 18527 = JCM 14202]
MATIDYLQALNQALDEELAQDDTLTVFGEDVGAPKGGVFNVTQGLAEKYGDLRVFNTPLSEAEIAGLAIGLGVSGHHAVAEFQFADYILPATNQIISEAARMRYRSQGDWSAPVVFRAPYGGGVGGGFYHSQSTEKVFVGQPGLRVVTPSTVRDAKGLLKSAIRCADPVLFFEHKRLYHSIKTDIDPDEEILTPIDKAQVLRQGTDITVMSYGITLQYVLQAAEELAKSGIQTEVVDIRSLYPLDEATIVAAAKKTGKVLLVNEDNKEGGVLGEISAIISEQALFDLDAPIKRLAGPDSPAMPYAKNLEQAFLVQPDQVKQAMQELAEF